MAQMVEHMIAPAEGHARLHDGVIHATLPNELLGRPLRLVVPGPRGRSSSQETQHHDLWDTGILCGGHDVRGPRHMHGGVRLGADLAIDPRTVRDSVAACKRNPQPLEICQAGRGSLYTRELGYRQIPPI